jgi:putative ABC transport system permease protein
VSAPRRKGLGFSLGARLLWREMRASPLRLVFFSACLALGVAAVVAVAGLSQALEETIRSRAREILAADVSVSARRPLPEDLELQFRTFDFELTRLREMATLVSSPEGRSQLVELKVVEGEYPFYGSLTLEPPAPLRELLAADACVVAPELLTRLRLARGDSIKIGEARFRIAAVVVAEPDRMNFSLTLGPRVFLSAAGFEQAHLEKQGSSIRYVALGKSPDGLGRAQALATTLRVAEPDSAYLNIQTYEEAQPLLRDGIRRTNRFLALTALAALLVGGIGIAQTVRAWIAGALDSVAIQKCLGMTSREILSLYLAQTLLLALFGSALGAGLGLAAEALVVEMFREFVPGQHFELLQPAALLRGVLLGLFVALLFSLRPLLATLAVPPARVLRRSAEPLEWKRSSKVALWILFGAGVVAAAWAQSESLPFALGFGASLLGVSLLLLAGALGLVRLAARPGRERLPLGLRHGLAALARPGAGTLTAILSLGLGILVVLSMQLVHQELGRELGGELPRGAPTVFLVDVQTDQWPGVRELLDSQGATQIESAPVVVGRLSKVDGRGIEELAKESRAKGNSRWTLTREQRMTYGPELPKDNVITEGSLWSDSTRAEVSVEREFAASLGAKLGSTLTFNIQGVELDLAVTSLRDVEWRSFGLNFFLFVEPGVLESAPQFRVAATRVAKDREDSLQDELALEFSNVTMLRVREILEKLASVLQKVGAGVNLLGWCTVLSGAVILIGAIGASAARRSREVALFKTLGLSRGSVARIYAIEHGLVGAVAGSIGAVGANALAWGVIRFGMELDWHFDPWANAITVAAATALAAGAGLCASLRALLIPPIQALRE